MKRHRSVSVVPSYLLLLVVMIIAGLLIAGTVLYALLPLTKQSGYLGKGVEYRYYANGNRTQITLANKKSYEAKVDVLIVDQSGRTWTSCIGYMASTISNKTAVGAISLIGLTLAPDEIVQIDCGINATIKDVKVFEYGVPEGSQGQAYVGAIPGSYYKTNASISPGQLKSTASLFYRIPITVVSTASETIAPAYVKVTLSPSTLPNDVWLFFKTHTRLDLADIVVRDPYGVSYPTKAVKNQDGSVDVYFKANYILPGTNYFYLYFGNPLIAFPHPLNESIKPDRLITTPNGLPNTIASTMAYPAYIIPEGNWLPECDGIEHGLKYIEVPNERGGRARAVTTFNNEVYYPLKNGDGAKILSLISDALNNMVYFPVGSRPSTLIWGDYSDKNPKTELPVKGWGIAAVAPLPWIGLVANGTVITTGLWVSSDDGSAAYLVAFSGTQLVYRVEYFDDIYGVHGPSYWNYGPYQVPLDPGKVGGTSMYLVVLTQNGLHSGSGPGYQDFRFVMWYVEQLNPYAPSAEEFASAYSQAYIDVKVYGLPNLDLNNYALPVDLTGRTDVDWARFDPSTVYVVDEYGSPVYFWVQVEEGRTVVWIKVNSLPAGSTRSFRIYYGGVNRYPSYNNPHKVFDFFDDFDTDPTKSGRWIIYWNNPNAYMWDSNQKIFYLIRNTYNTGIAMFMNIDWRTNFHVHFRTYISGQADGLTFTFFKDISAYEGALPSYGGSLALDARISVYGYLTPIPSRGYAVEFDIYRNNYNYEPSIPHIALVETFSSMDVSDNTHYAYNYNINYKDRWISVDVYYYNGVLEVYVDGVRAFSYSGWIFSLYGIRYGGMGFTAATGVATGTFAIDTVFLRYYPGRVPQVVIQGYK